jgi:hypothetical protein
VSSEYVILEDLKFETAIVELNTNSHIWSIMQVNTCIICKQIHYSIAAIFQIFNKEIMKFASFLSYFNDLWQEFQTLIYTICI